MKKKTDWLGLPLWKRFADERLLLLPNGAELSIWAKPIRPLFALVPENRWQRDQGKIADAQALRGFDALDLVDAKMLLGDLATAVTLDAIVAMITGPTERQEGDHASGGNR